MADGATEEVLPKVVVLDETYERARSYRPPHADPRRFITITNQSDLQRIRGMRLDDKGVQVIVNGWPRDRTVDFYRGALMSRGWKGSE